VRNNMRDDDQWGELPDPSGVFLPDDSVDESRAFTNDLRDRVAKLETQMMQQYTAMAAYATIAQRNVETVQAEMRSDIDRAQSTSVGLIERVRRECNEQIQALRGQGAGVQGAGGAAATADQGATNARFAVMEQRFEALATALERSIQNQCVLAEQLAVLLDERMQRDGWLASSGNPLDLSLR